MTVDIRLNQMVAALDERLKSIPLEDVEFSVRTLNALYKLGARNLYDVQIALTNRTLHKSKGIGAKSVKEAAEVVTNVCAVLPIPVPVSESEREKQLEQVLEMFMSWTGALAISGNITRDAWCELVDLRAEAERVFAR